MRPSNILPAHSTFHPRVPAQPYFMTSESFGLSAWSSGVSDTLPGGGEDKKAEADGSSEPPALAQSGTAFEFTVLGGFENKAVQKV